MSILVRGMEMPNNCDKCRFQSALKLYCDAMPYNFCGNTNDIERPDWCPLVGVPTPHGRLIDADELIEDMKQIIGEQSSYKAWALLDTARKQPTIIEAEGSEDEQNKGCCKGN